MDTIAVAPVTPPPTNEAPAPREDKEDDDKKPAFDKALKQELALLGPDASKADAKDADDAAAAGAGDAAADPALAGLLADATQPQTAALDAAAAAAAAHAGHAQAAVDVLAKPRGATERLSGERVATERNATETGATERGSVDRLVSARDAKARTLDLADRRSTLKSDDSAVQDQPHAAADSSAQSAFSAFTGDRAGAPAFAPATTPPASPLDGLAAASMVAKWSAGPQAAADAAPAPATARIDTPLGAAGWSDAFQQKIVWLVDRQQQSAELHINPPHLGPVEVMLNLSDDGARVAFCSPHAAVRDAIEASLPDLQAALGDRGVALGQATVSADSGAAREQFAGNNMAGDSRGGSRHGRSGSGVAPVSIDAPRVRLVARGLVDTFA